MSNYWLGVALLCLVAAGFIAIPWILKRNRLQQDALTNTHIIKQRMIELDREVAEGLIDADEKQVAINELKIALIDETSPVPEQTHSSKWALLTGLAVTVGMTGAVYLYSNEVSEIKHWQKVTSQSAELAKRIVIEADPTVTSKEIEDFALAMRTKLLNTPNDHIGWLLLGRLHAAVNRVDSALQAFERAYALAPDHQGVAQSYIQLLVMTGQEEYLNKARFILEVQRAKQPDNLNALGMLALTVTQLGDKPQAIVLWESLKAKLPEGDPMRGEVNKQLAALGINETPAGGTSVLVTVSLDDSLMDKLPSEGFLFVFAQDASGSVRMPAAVVKQPLTGLPIKLELSDMNAMLPTYTLSQLSNAKLVARISLDENVAQTSGELQGEVLFDVEKGTRTTQHITIDKELM